MKTTVIVVSYRSHPWLERCLESVLGQADEVILVDNGSPGGGIGDVGRRLGAKVEPLPRNTGFAGGVNAGLRRAGGDVIALLNDDAMASPEWLRSAAAVLGDPAVAAVGPKILFPGPYVEVRCDMEPHFVPIDPRPLGRLIHRVEVDSTEVPLGSLFGAGIHKLEESHDGGVTQRWRWTSGAGPICVPVPEGVTAPQVEIDGEALEVKQFVSVISNAGSYLSANGHGGDYGFGAADDGRFDLPCERFATTGAAMVATAETFARVGRFAENYFAYYEDLDWCWRARLAGLRCMFDPSATVHHVGGASTGGPGAERVRRLAARNRIQTLIRNAPPEVVWHQLRSPVDRPAGLILPIARRMATGAVERRRLARGWTVTPRAVWDGWAGRDETW